MSDLEMAAIMREQIELEVKRAGDAPIACSITIDCAADVSLKFSGPSLPAREYLSTDLFDALALLRDDLEALGYRSLCAGARIDVYPSGMCRSMAHGRKAYILKLGVRPTSAHLIDIFVGSTAENIGAAVAEGTSPLLAFGPAGWVGAGVLDFVGGAVGYYIGSQTSALVYDLIMNPSSFDQSFAAAQADLDRMGID